MEIRLQAFESLDSTNNYLKKLAAEGAAEGTVIIADENNFCFIAITLHGGIGQRQRRIDMTAGTAGHQHHLHLIHSSYQSILSVDEKLVFPSVCRFVQVRIRIITQKCQLV